MHTETMQREDRNVNSGHSSSKSSGGGVMCGLETWQPELNQRAHVLNPSLHLIQVSLNKTINPYAPGSLSSLTNLCSGGVGGGWALCSMIDNGYCEISYKRCPTVAFCMRYTIEQYNLMKSAPGLGLQQLFVNPSLTLCVKSLLIASFKTVIY